jgi:thioesterase domain-containing protein
VNRVAARGRQAREKVETFMRGLKKIDRLRDVWHAPLREKTEFVVKNSRKLLTRRGAVDQTTTTAGIAEGNAGISATDREWLIAAYHWILTSYVPKRYRGRITLFLTDDHLEQTPFILKQWQKAAPQTQVERIPGKHLTCITTHLAAIAKKIRLELETLRTFVSMLLPAVSSQLGLFEI